MQDLKRVALRTVRERFGGSAESPTYRCRIDIEVERNEFITILDTERVSDSYRHAETAIAQIEPFAKALSTTLQLPLTKSKKPIDAPRLFEMLVRDQKPVLVTVALIVGLAVSLTGFQLYRGFADRNLVRQAGGSVSSYSYGVGDRTVLADGRLYDFSDSELTDEKFSVIAPIILRDRQPIALNLSGTVISDVSIALLKDASRIRILNLKDCQVGDAAASSIGDMRGLIYLTLTNTQVTDIGLESLARVSSLQYLGLGSDRSSPISNRGLKHLGRLRYLRDLYLHNTQVTEEAVAELQARLKTVDVRIPEF